MGARESPVKESSAGRVEIEDRRSALRVKHREDGPQTPKGAHHGIHQVRLFISLDGVIETPDTWHFPYFNDEMGAAVGQLMSEGDATLLGKRTSPATGHRQTPQMR